MKIISKIFIVCTMVCLCNTVAIGQEKIIEVKNFLDVSSIVRSVNDKDWLVCNNSLGQTKFSLVNESATSTPQLFLGYIDGTDSTRIFDFEVFNDTVYFCGATWYGSTSQAVWGYFPLAGFPSVSVKYIVRSMGYLSKIDVFSIDPTMNEVHVVMVGRLNQKNGIIVDEVRVAPDQFIEYAGTVDDVVGRYYADVAVTDNYVVTSMRAASGEILNNGQVLFISKPTTLSTSIFACAALSYPIPGNASAGLLEHCTGDAVVVVYGGIFNKIGIHSFIGTLPYSHLSIKGRKDYTLHDIKFDKTSEDLDILVKSMKSLSEAQDSSIILHLNQSLSTYGGPLFCHMYLDERLNSLDWIPWEKNCFVASGHDVGGSHLRVYKYQYNNWQNCTQQKIMQAEKLDMNEFKKVDLYYDACEVEMLELESYEMATPLTIICE